MGLLIGAVPLPHSVAHPWPTPLPGSPGGGTLLLKGGRAPTPQPAGLQLRAVCMFGAAPLAWEPLCIALAGTQPPPASLVTLSHRQTQGCLQAVVYVWTDPPPSPGTFSGWPLHAPDLLEPTQDMSSLERQPSAASTGGPSWGPSQGPSQGQPCSREAGLAATRGVRVGLWPGMDSFVCRQPFPGTVPHGCSPQLCGGMAAVLA